MALTDFERTPMACRVCRVPVNRFAHADGSGEEWLHAQIWNEYDHDPDPVPHAELDGAPLRVCDFCGASDDVIWQYDGADMRLRVDGTLHNYGTRWAGCIPCDAFIRAGDPVGTVERAVRFTGPLKQMRGEQVSPQLRQRFLDLHTEFIRSIHTRVLIPGVILPPPRRLSPTQLPKVRDRLAQLFAGDLRREQMVRGTGEPFGLPAADHGRDDGFAVRALSVSPQVADAFCRRVERSLLVADLFWVSKEFTLLAVGSGKKLPDLSVSAASELPAGNGVVVFAEPVMEIPVADRRVAVVAMSWMLVPGGVWVIVYGQPEQFMPEESRDDLAAVIGWLMPASNGGGITFGTHDADSPGQETFRTLLATWFLMAQGGVAQTRPVEIDKGIRRAYSRAKRPVPQVRLVELRLRPRQAPRTAQSVAAGRTYSVRWLVGGKDGLGFWRTYWLKPGSARCQCTTPPDIEHRERRWIFPYIAGPDGKPVKGDPQDVVKVLR